MKGSTGSQYLLEKLYGSSNLDRVHLTIARKLPAISLTDQLGLLITGDGDKHFISDVQKPLKIFQEKKKDKAQHDVQNKLQF